MKQGCWIQKISLHYYFYFVKCLSFKYAAAKSPQSCLTLCDPIPGILQARTLEWVAISFSSAEKWKLSRSVVSDSLRPHGLQPTRLLHPLDFPGKSTGVGCHCLPCLGHGFVQIRELGRTWNSGHAIGLKLDSLKFFMIQLNSKIPTKVKYHISPFLLKGVCFFFFYNSAYLFI